MNSTKCDERDNVDITIEIEKQETNIGCDIIGRRSRKKETDWYKDCPRCGKVQYYQNQYYRNKALNSNKVCRSCSKTESTRCLIPKISSSGEYIRTCPSCSKEIRYRSYHSFSKMERKHSVCACCNRSLRRGKFRHTDDAKQKMRESIQNRTSYPNYNPVACTYMDSLKPEYNFQHALNGGEVRVCGYSVDGYDKEKNVVFEYDEPRHYKRDDTLKEKDVKRMNIIKEHLNCKFIRYNERKKSIFWY